MTSGGTGFISALYQLFMPLQLALTDSAALERLLKDLGWVITLTPPQARIIGQLLPLAEVINELEDLAGENPSAGSSTAGADLARAVEIGTSIFEAVAALEALNSSQLKQLPSPLDAPASWEEIALDLPEFLLLRWLAIQSPFIYAFAVFSGVVVEEPRPDDRPARRRLVWDALGSLLQDPPAQVAGVYGWGEVLDHDRLFEALAGLGAAAGLRMQVSAISPQNAGLVFPSGGGEDLSQLNLLWQTGYSPANGLLRAAWALLPAPGGGTEIEGVMFASELSGLVPASLDLGHGLALEFRSGADQNGALAFILLPDGVHLAGPSARNGVEIAFSGQAEETWVLLGEATGTRLELDDFEALLSLGGTVSAPELTLQLSSSSQLRLVVQPAEADSFLSGVLGSAPLITQFPCTLAWSSLSGFSFQASAGFAVEIPLSIHLGPVEIQSISLLVSGGGEGALLEIRTAAALKLGPLDVVVDGLGFSAGVTVLPGGQTDGVFGNLDAEIGLLPPEGLGVSIDSGAVSGGGYLYIDSQSGEYSGIFDLELLSVGICAIGLISTQQDDGGWSFFLGLFIEVPSIPLGFGFTITGVGGLAGVNRTLDTDGLEIAIQSGSLDEVLFPRDPIGDAPLIIAALQDIFPPAGGRYVFGPVIQIGWGVPTLITGTIGVVISLPDPVVIAVLGSLTSALPSSDVELVGLYLNVAGVIDLASGSISVDASLHGSHIAGFVLTGDMALRASFGEQPDFLMALGGFNPGFAAPAGFPALERLALAVNAGDWIDIRFACYLAVTTNSLQFGAAFDMSAEVEGFGITGGAGFDALITFSPFSLQTNLGLYVSVKAAGVDLMGVWLECSLSGPNPWYVSGKVTFKILGVETTLKVDQQIGSKTADPAPALQDVLGQLRTALAQTDAWAAVGAGGEGVILAGGEPSPTELSLPPDGSLCVSQRVVPLGITIDKSVPWQIDGGYDLFDLAAEEPGMAASGDFSDWFPVSSFVDLNPKEQLSAPSFERHKSGITFGSSSVTAGIARLGTLDFEQILLDPTMAKNSVKLPAFNLATDPRSAVLFTASVDPVRADFTLAQTNSPYAVQQSDFALVDQISGASVTGGLTWMAAHARAAEFDNAAVGIAPVWEVK